MDKEAKKALVTVDDDQLSLAIGKKGQNVRLAAKLTGWDIDIKSKAMLAEAAAPKLEEKKVAAKEEVDISSIAGIGPKTKKLLEAAKLDTVEAIASSSVEEITKIKGIGEKTAEKILKGAKELLKKK